MNLSPLNPYMIIKGLTEENEKLRTENEGLRKELEEKNAVLDRAGDGQDTE